MAAAPLASPLSPGSDQTPTRAEPRTTRRAGKWSAERAATPGRPVAPGLAEVLGAGDPGCSAPFGCPGTWFSFSITRHVSARE